MSRIVCYRSRKAKLAPEAGEHIPLRTDIAPEHKRALAKNRREAEAVTLEPKRAWVEPPKQVTEF